MKAFQKSSEIIVPNEQLDIRKYLMSTPSTLILLGINLFTIIIAVWQKWSPGEIILLYYIQSLIIGFFQFFKLLDLENFSTEGVKINGMPTEPTKGTKYFFTGFFVMHFGIFHLVYLIFLFVFLQFGFFEIVFSPLFIASVVLMFANHASSYLLNRNADKKRFVNIGKVFFLPYARIIPMHLIIISMGFLVSASQGSMVLLITFMILKTIADIITHNAEHHINS